MFLTVWHISLISIYRPTVCTVFFTVSDHYIHLLLCSFCVYVLYYCTECTVCMCSITVLSVLCTDQQDLLFVDVTGVVHTGHPRIGSDGESEDASGASDDKDDFISPVRMRNKNRRLEAVSNNPDKYHSYTGRWSNVVVMLGQRRRHYNTIW